MMFTKLVKKEEFFISQDFPLSIAWRDPQPEFPLHKHQFTELLIITRGSATHVIDDLEFNVSRGDVFIINAERTHGFTDLNDLALVNVIFDKEGMGLTNWNTTSLPGFRVMFNLEPEYRASHNFKSRLELNGKDLESTISTVRKMTEEIEKKSPGYEVYTTGLFMQLITFLSRCYGKSRKPQSMSLLRLAESINFIEKEFTTDISIDELAEIAHMSSRNFQRVFTKTMGIAARDYIIELRLKHACTLLSRPDMLITDIAYESGFNDSNYFSRVFKKRYGLSPREYRH